MQAPRWYHETWAIVIAGLLCPPLAIYLVLRKPDAPWPARALVLAAMGAILISLALLELFGGLIGTGIARYRAFTLRQRAVFMHRTGKSAPALDLMLRAWELYPADGDLGLDAARLALKIGRRAQAASLLSALTRNSSVEDEAVLELAGLWISDPATFDRGRRLLEDALEQRRVPRDDPTALVLRGRLELARGDMRSAEYLFRQVVAQFRRDLYDPVYLQLAGIAKARGEPRREIAYLCESLRADWDQPLARARLFAAVREQKLPLAEYQVFARALELHEDLDAYDEARALWQRILDRHPGFLHRDGCHYMLATSNFYYKRDYAAALEHYRTVVARHPESESFLRALYQCGQCEEKLGQDVQAARDYRRLADTAPTGTALWKLASAALVRMQKLGRIGDFPLIFGGEP